MQTSGLFTRSIKDNILSVSSVFLFSLLLHSCNPETNYFKGNMHAHSLWSDGDHFPEMVMNWYESNGYHFAVLSDHNILQEGEKWIFVNRNETVVKAYNAYLKEFGREYIEEKFRNDSHLVKLRTFEEFHEIFDKPGHFLTIPAEELTDGFNGKPVHMNVINLQSRISPTHGNSIPEILDLSAESIRHHEDSLERPLFSFINHPNFGWALTKEHLAMATGFQFFEVYNGHPSVRNYGDSLHMSTEDLWDQANLERLQNGQQLLLGVATDDAHNYHEFREGRANPGRGWVMVRTGKLEKDPIIEALKSGDFYSSTGVVVKDFRISRGKYSVSLEAETGIEYTIQFIGCMKGKDNAEILKTIQGTAAIYHFTGNELFVRAKVISTQPKSNPFAAGDVEVAWLQPAVH